MESNEFQLSDDLNTIATRIKSNKNLIGYSLIEIGRDLNEAKQKDLAHGDWLDFLQVVGIQERQAQRMMKVAKELGSNTTALSDLPFTTLYEIATLPQEEREKEHITFRGETKKVDEMTVRELQELKRKLNESELAKTKIEQQLSHSRQSEQLAIQQLEAEQSKEPLIKEIEKVVDHTDYKKIEKLTELNERLSGQIEQEKVKAEEIKKQLERQEKRTEKYSELKTEHEKTQERLLAMTQEQHRLSDRRLVYTHISKMTQDVNKTLGQIKLVINEGGSVDGDQDVHNSLTAFMKTLEEMISEVEELLGIQGKEPLNNQRVSREGMIIEAEFSEIN